MKRKIRGWELTDSIVAATAKVYKAAILTGDKHFKNLKRHPPRIRAIMR